jgi:hypothetical protein
MKLGDPPQAQTASQLVPQIVLGVIQRGEGVTLRLIVASNSYNYMSMASIWRNVDEVHFHRKQARIRHLEAD